MLPRQRIHRHKERENAITFKSNQLGDEPKLSSSNEFPASGAKAADDRVAKRPTEAHR